MSVRFSWTVQDAEGDAQVGLNVDLYYNGGAKYADMTDNGDGSYYCTVATSGKYDVYIGGVRQDEGTGIYIAADDSATDADLALKADKVTGAASGNLAGLNSSGNLTDSGYDPTDFLQSSHANANGSGGSSTPATNKVHNAAAVGVIDSGGLLTATDVEGALAEMMALIGDSDFETASFIKDASDITSALLMLSNQLYDLYLRGGDSSTTTQKMYISFMLAGNTGASGYVPMPNITAAQAYFRVPTPSYISGVFVSWTGASMTSTDIDVGLEFAGSGIDMVDLINIAKTDTDAGYQKAAAFSAGNSALIVPAGYGLIGCEYERNAGSGYLTNLCVTIEITIGTATT